MIKNTILITILTFGIILSLSANPVDKNRAQIVAENFYSLHMNEGSFPGIQSYQLISFNGINSYYAFNVKNQKGFVLVAANDASIPVLAYSFHGSYNITNQPENFALTIDQYNHQLEYIQQNQIQATQHIVAQWSKYSKPAQSKAAPPIVGPLLSSIWAQGCYYNEETPADMSGPCNHVVTGCVATAMAQVLNYHQFPNTGSGSHSYASTYGNLTANFGSTTYNWSFMSDTLTSQSTSQNVSAVSTLISHCGIAVDMQYSAGGSGAYSQDAANAFNHYFNYDINLQLLHRASFTDSIWEQMVRTELDSLRPLYYDGSGSGGHAFVCDGYQSDHYFHFNWGWSGSYNGYFLLTALNPGGMNFSNYCGAVFGMKPGVPQICSGITDTSTSKSGNISDGSYGQDYQNNANCTWLINPIGAVSVSLEFYTFEVQASDSLYIYDGSDNSAPLIAAYSGNTIPASLASSGGQMYLQFVTNNQTAAAGWSAYYRSEYCNGQQAYTDPSGTFSDGSGTENYNDNTSCYWLMTDTANNSINLEFTFFETELAYDFVDVYDGSTTSSNLLGSFSGNQLPQSLSSSGGAMLVHFHSDGGVTDQGWEANYYTCGQPSAPYSSDTAFFCANDSISLIIPNYVDSFLWLENGIGNASITSKQWAVSQAGVYSYVAYSTVCPDITSPSVVAFENQSPQFDLGSDTILCNYLSLQIVADSGYASYQWNTGDTSQSIIVNANGGAIQNIELKITNDNLCSNTDSLIVEFVDCTAIDENMDISFDLFPNPAQDYIQLRFPYIENSFELNIYDVNGRLVFHKEYQNTNSTRINTTKLLTGRYYLEIKENAKSYSKSFIKQ
ncbi:MAG: C10 family peptidase [Bacteroidales bacterium]|nr:C10 family peptidase [Bacteroidales bacterium]